jgi:hypothetical protein
MSTTKKLLRASAIFVLASIVALIVWVLIQQTVSGPPSLFAYVRVPEYDDASLSPTMGLSISNAGPVAVLFRIRSPSPSVFQRGTIMSAHRRHPWVRAVKGEVVQADDVYFDLVQGRIVIEARRRNTEIQRVLHACLRSAKAIIATHSLHLAKKIYKSDPASYEFSEGYELGGASSELVNPSGSPKVILLKLAYTGSTFRY